MVAELLLAAVDEQNVCFVSRVYIHVHNYAFMSGWESSVQ